MDQVKEAARAASDFQSHPLLTLINTSHCPPQRQGRLSLSSTARLPDVLLSLRPATHNQHQRFGQVHHPGDASSFPARYHTPSAWQTEYAARTSGLFSD